VSRYERAERYYRGSHDLAFASAKFQNAFGALFREFALNLCPAVCDSVRDKLIVKGFGVEDEGESHPASNNATRGNRLSPTSQRGENHPVGETPTPLLPPPRPRKASATPPPAGGEPEGSLNRESRRIWYRNLMLENNGLATTDLYTIFNQH